MNFMVAFDHLFPFFFSVGKEAAGREKGMRGKDEFFPIIYERLPLFSKGAREPSQGAPDIS